MTRIITWVDITYSKITYIGSKINVSITFTCIDQNYIHYIITLIILCLITLDRKYFSNNRYICAPVLF